MQSRPFTTSTIPSILIQVMTSLSLVGIARINSTLAKYRGKRFDSIRFEATKTTPAEKAQLEADKARRDYVASLKRNLDWEADSIERRMLRQMDKFYPSYHAHFDHWLSAKEMEVIKGRVDQYIYHNVWSDPNLYWGELFRLEREQMDRDYESFKPSDPEPVPTVWVLGSFAVKDIKKAYKTIAKKTAFAMMVRNHRFSIDLYNMNESTITPIDGSASDLVDGVFTVEQRAFTRIFGVHFFTKGNVTLSIDESNNQLLITQDKTTVRLNLLGSVSLSELGEKS